MRSKEKQEMCLWELCNKPRPTDKSNNNDFPNESRGLSAVSVTSNCCTNSPRNARYRLRQAEMRPTSE